MPINKKSKNIDQSNRNSLCFFILFNVWVNIYIKKSLNCSVLEKTRLKKNQKIFMKIQFCKIISFSGKQNDIGSKTGSTYKNKNIILQSEHQKFFEKCPINNKNFVKPVVDIDISTSLSVGEVKNLLFKIRDKSVRIPSCRICWLLGSTD